MNTEYTSAARLAGLVTLLIAVGGLGCEDSTGPTAPREVTEPVALDRIDATTTYHGLRGGLVDNGTPTVTPVDGRIVIVAISMSNGRLEFDRFIELYRNHVSVSPAIGLVNCARGGNALERWVAQQDLWDDCKSAVRAAGFRPEQVRVVWAKNANQFTDHGRTLPHPEADYHDLVSNITTLSRRVRQEIPSVQAVFHSSRIYGGYVAAARMGSRGEPISFEGGLAINAVIEKQKRGELTDAPWIGWGPYLWADGRTPNGAGLSWEPADFQDGGTDPHPTATGQTKVADALHRHLLQFAWYRR